MHAPARLFAVATLAACCALPASAAIRTFDLDQISSASIGAIGTSLGTVTLTDIVGGVDVLVNLAANTAFVDTGGPHTAFAFNLASAPGAITIVEPNPNSRPGPRSTQVTLFQVLSGPQGATPYGTYTNGIDCPGCGPGASHAYGGPLRFTVAGVDVSDFLSNAQGYFFAADVRGPAGGTGSIAALAPAVPEPSTWAMMLVGFLGLGLASRRRLARASA